MVGDVAVPALVAGDPATCHPAAGVVAQPMVEPAPDLARGLGAVRSFDYVRSIASPR